MSKYHFKEIESKWQKFWAENQTFKAENPDVSEVLSKPKYYVLDMFPYPSGAGLHVGHPLGYIASDIYSRFKRHKGYNVLHPMGYDSFGLPAEQYAIQTGQHPATTTEENISRYREQLDKIGFSFDWSREVRTSNPEYYQWTQWIFLQLFNSWYDIDADKAKDISDLEDYFSKYGNAGIQAVCDENIPAFTAEEWKGFSHQLKQQILLGYRLTYLAETEVNWCPQLGTVLANDEIVNGVSERGGYQVVRRKMKQWSMRITAYAQRLLDGLDNIDWPQPLKDSQTNWIGRSKGASVTFKVLSTIDNEKAGAYEVPVFTTRPDTIFGVSFMVLAPEHHLVKKITTAEQMEEVDRYVRETSKKSELERLADVKTITGAFTGAYAEHPFTGAAIPIWIGDYVLAGYGTGAVMSVPCGDQRDYAFAKHFNLPIPNIFKDADISQKACSDKENAVIVNSDFLNGLDYARATDAIIKALEKKGVGKGKINYRLRDAVFSRQRYWGEPFPIYYKNGMPVAIPAECLPLRLPEIEKYLPTETGEPPLGRAEMWAWNTVTNQVVSKELIDHQTIFPLELNTMPGWAGSSWYLFRYMEPGLSDPSSKRDETFASQSALEYWKNVDLYIGGSEHATGHLLYSRFWVKFLYDRGLVPVEEPFKKLINQGMILGESALIFKYTLKTEPKIDIFISNGQLDFNGFDPVLTGHAKKELNKILNERDINEDPEMLISEASVTPLHADISFVDVHNNLDVDAFQTWRGEYGQGMFITDVEGNFKIFREVEKMSKSKYNVVNPDDICEQYGADTLRMYEMFLGPLEQAKPWNTAGITGVHGFLKKLWKLYHSGENNSFFVSEEAASKESLRTLHKTIKKVQEDIENFSFNTSVSSFMIAVNDLQSEKQLSREVLEPLAVLISPYAPHIAEELWQKLGHSESISKAPFPVFNEQFLAESSKEYPISFNGKLRFTLELPLDLAKEEIESVVMAHDRTRHYLEGRTPKKVIIIPGKIVNLVV